MRQRISILTATGEPSLNSADLKHVSILTDSGEIPLNPEDHNRLSILTDTGEIPVDLADSSDDPFQGVMLDDDPFAHLFASVFTDQLQEGATQSTVAPLATTQPTATGNDELMHDAPNPPATQPATQPLANAEAQPGRNTKNQLPSGAGGPNPNSGPYASTPDTINGPIDALAHYEGGGGADATLGPGLIDELKEFSWYQRVLNETIPNRLNSESPDASGAQTITLSDQETGLSTGPGFSSRYHAKLNNTIGTIDSLDWSARCTPTVLNKRGGAVTIAWKIEVLFKLSKYYTFDSENNRGVEFLIVRPIEVVTRLPIFLLYGVDPEPYTIRAQWTDHTQYAHEYNQ